MRGASHVFLDAPAKRHLPAPLADTRLRATATATAAALPAA